MTAFLLLLAFPPLEVAAILQLSDRIVVMFDGKLALETDAASADVGAIGRAMAGH